MGAIYLEGFLNLAETRIVRSQFLDKLPPRNAVTTASRHLKVIGERLPGAEAVHAVKDSELSITDGQI